MRRINFWILESPSSITCHLTKNFGVEGIAVFAVITWWICEDLLPKDTRARKGGKPWLWRSSKPWMHGGCSHVGMNPAGKPCSSGGPALEVGRKIEGISWCRILKDQEMSGDIRRYVEVFQDSWWNPREHPSCDGHNDHDISWSHRLYPSFIHHSALATYPSETWGAECRYPFSPDRGVQHASSVRNHIGATEAEESLIYRWEWNNNFQNSAKTKRKPRRTQNDYYRKWYKFTMFICDPRYPDALYNHVP